MGSIEKNLSVNERIIYLTQLHWLIYVRGIILITLGIIGAFSKSEEIDTTFDVILIVAGVLWLVRAALVVNLSEFAVTNKRVVLKTGLLNKQLVDLQLDGAKRLVVTQGIIGKIFNFGSIKITSDGVTESFNQIASPFEFKKQVDNTIEQSFVVKPNSSSLL
jgi:uncharacterized membrane protein YdbT with pleckstrin-like domain